MIFAEFLSAIKQGAMVITVNQRLARNLSARLEQAFIADGLSVWPAVKVISYDSWLLQCWQRRFEFSKTPADDYLISPEQSLALWEKVINDSDESVLLNISATAKAAAKARMLSYQWSINSDTSFANGKEDVAAFSRWHEQYKKTLADNAWLDRAELISRVKELLTEDGFLQAELCIFAGFDVFTASQLELLNIFEAQGVTTAEFVIDDQNLHLHKFCADDAEDELMCMAQWAKEQLLINPEASIGLVVPDLNAKQNALEAAFQAVFYPDIIYPTQLPAAKRYNVSLGRSLADSPLIKQLFRGLSLFSHELALAELAALLRSPFIVAGESEWSARASFEAALRDQGYLSINLKQFVKRLGKATGCTELLSAASSVLVLQQSKPHRAPASVWAELFRQLVKTAGWPGERVISSVEFQVLQAWDEVLQDFSRLDYVLAPISLEGAIAQLNKIAKARVFQPETPTEPIQIMGLMEAAGHNFDALWVCGLDARSWPPVANPIAFLPLAEQLKQGLVQASSDLQYSQAKRITDNWRTAATQVVLSYPAFIDETKSLASPLIDDIAQVIKTDLLASVPKDPLLQQLAQTELIEQLDEQAPALAEQTQSKGGVGVIKDQSACPFKAFAHYRLQARALSEPEPGIDAMLRGSLVHACLEMVWLQLKTQSALLGLTEQQREDCVSAIAKEVVAKQSQFEPVLKGRFGELEAARLQKVVLDWLLVDAAREPFGVFEVEFKQAISIGNLHINTTIDRIDTLQDGTMAIIDYKTGSVRPQSWFSERIEEPQLPLYTVFSAQDIQSIAFAQLKKGQNKYAGITNSDGHFSALKMIDKEKASQGNWGEQLSLWGGQLTDLATEYVTGYAAVKPTAKACEYCDLSPLCRVNDSGQEISV